jgi:hypothetical protein
MAPNRDASRERGDLMMPRAACDWLPFALAMTLAGAAGPLSVSVPVTPVPGSRQPDRPYDMTLTLPDGTGKFRW